MDGEGEREGKRAARRQLAGEEEDERERAAGEGASRREGEREEVRGGETRDLRRAMEGWLVGRIPYRATRAVRDVLY
eukprot:3737961-Rhodomonas_salina.2